LTYERSQILVSSGAKQTCFNVCAALLDPGDECVIPAPYWVSYPDMALLADGAPVSVYAGPEQGYKITAAQLAATITPRTKMLFLNSPSNPTGAAYTKAELQALGAVLDKHPRSSSPRTRCTNTSIGAPSRIPASCKPTRSFTIAPSPSMACRRRMP